MAREVTKKCDICGQATERIVGKMHFIPSDPGVGRLVHSNYTHHLDVGICCKPKVFKAFRWQTRISAKEYRDKRKSAQAQPHAA
jgi:hypothetical protein